MAILPSDPFALSGSIASESEPGLTWFIDKASGRISGTVDDYAAVRQAVEIILRTDRFDWQIYSPSSGVDYRNLIGRDIGYVAIELQRRIVEALAMDDRVLGIDKYDFTISGDSLSVSFIVLTIFGDFSESLEVALI